MRVASSWAHDGYGGVTIPRVGMEVSVTFLEGDPDKPLITVCLHHADNCVPYELPAAKTRTVLKTRSTPGGGGLNELRMATTPAIGCCPSNAVPASRHDMQRYSSC